MNVIKSSAIVTWGDWMSRWNCQDLSLFERLGLIYYGYDVRIDPKNNKERAERFAFYLELSDSSSSGPKEISRKARSVLVNKVMAGPEPDIELIIDSPYAQAISMVLTKFLCFVSADGYGNWTFRTSGDHEGVETSKWFTNLLKFILVNKSGWSDSVPTARGSMILKAFLEAPSELWVIIRNLNPGLFTLADLQGLLARLGDMSPEEASVYSPSDILSWVGVRQKKGKLGSGFDRLIGNRSIMGPLRHHEALLLITGLVKEQEEEARKFVGVG